VILEETLPRKKGNALLWAGLGLLIASISATLSATITINTDNRIEFGQGVKYIDACDDWVKITPRSGSGVELPFVKYIDIAGLDTSRCKDTDITVALYKSGVNESLDLYGNPITSGFTCSDVTSRFTGKSASPSGQSVSTACDGNLGTVWVGWNLTDTATVNVTLSSNQEVGALDFIGGADDSSYPGRKVWSTELLSCNSDFSSCSSIGSKALFWNDGALPSPANSNSWNNSFYPSKPSYLNPFWKFDSHAANRYFQMKVAPWGRYLGSSPTGPDYGCDSICVQINEIVPISVRNTVVLNVNPSEGGVFYKSPANSLISAGTACSNSIGLTSDNTNKINLDYCSNTGTYTLTFHVPFAPISDVNTVTIQTRNAAVRQDFSN